jgi:hypothetical protein
MEIHYHLSSHFLLSGYTTWQSFGGGLTMHRLSSLKKIEIALKSLSLIEQRKLVARMSQHLREHRGQKKPVRDWSKLYGLGKGIWKRQDAQSYVNRIREDRV